MCGKISLRGVNREDLKKLVWTLGKVSLMHDCRLYCLASYT